MDLKQFLSATLALALPCAPFAAAEQPGTLARATATWRTTHVTTPRFTNAGRYAEFLKAGQLYLSLRDAVTIAIENNLDVEFQRYNVLASRQDTRRTRGGGTTRGLLYTIAEAPIGIGGPSSPLLTSIVSQNDGGRSVTTNPSEFGVLSGAQSNLSLLGNSTLSTGTPLPQFDPKFGASLGYARTNAQQTWPNSTGTNALVSNLLNADAKLSQGFATGATATLGFDNSRYSSNNVSSLYNPYTTSSLNLSVTQPLLRGFGSKVSRRYQRIAAGQERIADLLFQQQLVSTSFGIVRLYIDLVSLNEDLRVREEQLGVNEWTERHVKERVDQGVMPPIESTRARAGVLSAKQAVIDARSRVEEQEAILKNVVFRRALEDPALREAHIVATDTLTTPTEADVFDASKLIADAFTQRPDLAQAGLQVEIQRIALEGSYSNLKPQLDVTAYAQNNGLAGANNTLNGLPAGVYAGGYGTALGQLIRHDNPSYGASLELTLPLRNRTAQADAARDEIIVHQASIRLEQLRNQARLEVQDAIIAMRRAQASYAAAAQATLLQKESFEAEKARNEEGVATGLTVAQFGSVYAEALRSEIAARGAYAKAKAALERATGTLLSDYGITPELAHQAQTVR